MQQSELYVNDILLDMPNDSLIALSYAVNNLADLKSVQGNISNSISLPDTANNRAALGFPDDINFNGASTIRKKQPCRYVQNGVDVIPQGNLRIVGASQGSLKIVVSSGNTDFFDLLTGKLRDLDFSEYDHIWNNDNVIASRLNNDGYIYPIINYGNLSNNTGDIHGQAIQPGEMRPAVFAKTVVKKICETVGYTLIDKIAADPVTSVIYNKLLLPFSTDKFIHSQRYVNLYSGQNVDYTQTNQLDWYGHDNGEKIPIPFNNRIADAASLYDGYYWTAPQIMTVDISASFPHIYIHRSGSVDDNIKGIYMKFYKIPAGSTDPFNDANKIYEPQNLGFDENDNHYYNFTMATTDVTVQPGDKLVAAFETAGHDHSTDVHIYPGAELTVKLNADNVNLGESIQVEAVLPDIGTTDFLKFISFLFCSIIQADNVNKTVTIVPFGYIVQNLPNAVDWSDKITNDGEDMDVQIGNYCQQNEAQYKQDDTVAPSTYGNGSFYLSDENLDLYQDIYDIPFAATLENMVLGNFRTSYIDKIDDVNNTDGNGAIFTVATEDRVVLLNKQNATISYRNGTTIVSTITDNAPFTYFTSSDGSPDLTMASIFKNHYTDLVNVLNDQRKLTCYLQLNEMDIQTLDFFRPVYIQKYAAYFYISKITDFTGVKPCKVDLIKLI